MMPDFGKWLDNYTPGSRGEYIRLLKDAYESGARDGCEFYMPAQQHLLVCSRRMNHDKSGPYAQQELEGGRNFAAYEIMKQMQKHWREKETRSLDEKGKVIREVTWSIKVSTP